MFIIKIILKNIIVYTDGSCLGNPGPGAWAFLAVESDEIVYEKFGSELYTTNNRMEMTAILEALKYLQKKYSKYEINLFSDSNLIIQTLNQGWKRKANLDLWKEIDLTRSKLNITYNWVKAHHQDVYNIRCDELAQASARSAQTRIQKHPELLKNIDTNKNHSAQKSQSDQSSLF